MSLETLSRFLFSYIDSRSSFSRRKEAKKPFALRGMLENIAVRLNTIIEASILHLNASQYLEPGMFFVKKKKRPYS